MPYCVPDRETHRSTAGSSAAERWRRSWAARSFTENNKIEGDMMKIILAIALFGVLFIGTGAAQNRGVYTSTKTSACRTISSNSNEAGSYEGECTGVGGYK